MAWEPLPLRFDKRAQPFALLHGGEVTLAIASAAKDPRSVLKVEEGGIEVRGVVTGSEVPLRSNKVVLLGGFIAPEPDARLRLVGAGPTSAQLLYDTNASDERVTLSLSRVRAAIACTDLTLEIARYDAWEELRGGTVESAELRRGAVLPVATAPDGRTVVTLQVHEAQPVVVLERRERRTRIAIRRLHDVVVGWVPNAALIRKSNLLESIGTIGHGAGFGRGTGFARTTASCAGDLPLISELRGERRLVGVVRAETPIQVEAEADDYAVVTVPGQIELVDGARFLALESDLQACRVRRPPVPFSKSEHRPSPPPKLRRTHRGPP